MHQQRNVHAHVEASVCHHRFTGHAMSYIKRICSVIICRSDTSNMQRPKEVHYKTELTIISNRFPGKIPKFAYWSSSDTPYFIFMVFPLVVSIFIKESWDLDRPTFLWIVVLRMFDRAHVDLRSVCKELSWSLRWNWLLILYTCRDSNTLIGEIAEHMWSCIIDLKVCSICQGQVYHTCLHLLGKKLF